MADEEREGTLRRVRHQFGRAEHCLEVTVLALTRVTELEPDWAEEFGSDVALLRSKLQVLQDLLDGQQ